MASLLYPKGKEAFLGAEIDLADDTIQAVIVSTSYTYDAGHDFYNDVEASAICTPVTLSGKSITNGVFDASNITFTDVDGAIGAIILFKNPGGASSTWRLIAHIDNMPELPASISGGLVPVTWDDGASKIFAL